MNAAYPRRLGYATRGGYCAAHAATAAGSRLGSLIPSASVFEHSASLNSRISHINLWTNLPLLEGPIWTNGTYLSLPLPPKNSSSTRFFLVDVRSRHARGSRPSDNLRH